VKNKSRKTEIMALKNKLSILFLITQFYSFSQNFESFKISIMSFQKDSAIYYFDKWVLEKQGSVDSLVRVYADYELDSFKFQLIDYAIEDKIKSIYFKEIKNERYKDFSFDLWKLGIYDQRPRTLSRYNNSKKARDETKKIDSLFRNNIQEWLIYSELDRKRKKEKIDFILNWSKINGWPTISKVGERASTSAFYLIQHSCDIKVYKKCLPLLKKELKNKNIHPNDYARMYDRNLIFRKKKQCFGTHAEDDFSSELKFKLSPIRNEKNVNKRRAKIGLGNIDEVYEYFKKIYSHN